MYLLQCLLNRVLVIPVAAMSAGKTCH